MRSKTSEKTERTIAKRRKENWSMKTKVKRKNRENEKNKGKREQRNEREGNN